MDSFDFLTACTDAYVPYPVKKPGYKLCQLWQNRQHQELLEIHSSPSKMDTIGELSFIKNLSILRELLFCNLDYYPLYKGCP